jgi:hypothetical protein
LATGHFSFGVRKEFFPMRTRIKAYLASHPFGAGVIAALGIMIGGASLAAGANHVHPFIPGTIDYEATTSGPVIFGLNSGSGLAIEGVTNTNAPAGAIALQGFGTSTTLASVGVNGAVSGPGSTALIGSANATTGAPSIGLEGFSKTGEGVFAQTLSTGFPALRALDGSAFFDVRLSDPSSGIPVLALLNTSSGAVTPAIEGDDTVSSSTINTGVLGVTTSGLYGVEGTAAGNSSAGVFGDGLTSSQFGVLGISNLGTGTAGIEGSSTTGIAVSGNAASNGIGVAGTTAGGNSVQGTATGGGQGGAFTSDTYAGMRGTSGGFAGVIGQCLTGGTDEFDGENSGFTINYTVDCTGHVTSTVRTRDGKFATVTAPKSTQSVLEDYGEAQLVNGRASVRLNPAFAEAISARGPYLVFITPGGDTNGIYVTNKTMQGFDVREVRGGRSTLTFDYRIVGKPADDNSAGISIADKPTVDVRGMQLAALAAKHTKDSLATLELATRKVRTAHVQAIRQTNMYEPYIGADGRLHSRPIKYTTIPATPH